MQKLPHYYVVKASAESHGSIHASADNLPALSVAPPQQFGGPGDQWSPEDLLMASVSNCLILTFRAIANIADFEWNSMQCVSKGRLEKDDGVIRFTRVESEVTLHIPDVSDAESAKNLVLKAERKCLISNSLNCEVHIHCDVITD